MSTRHTTPRTPRQRGMTLVELLIAMVLGLVLMAGVMQVFVSNRAAYSFNEGLSRLQENGRFATDALSFHGRMAGYLGCLSDISIVNNLGTGNPLAFDFGQSLFGYEAVGTNPGDTFAAGAVNPANSADATDWSGSLPAALVGDVLPGSDVLIVRNMTPQSHTLLSPFSDADKVYVDAAVANYTLGGIGVVSDCQKASVFQITGISSETSGISLSHATGTYTPANVLATWDTDQQYAAGAEMRRAETWIYYVGARNGNGPPVLFQQSLQQNGAVVELVAEELVEGVDTMQVLYGVDSDGDAAVDAYTTANSVADWGEVVSLRIGLLMRAPDEYGAEFDTQTYDVNETQFNPDDDRRVREVFTTTVAIRNRLP